MKQIIVSYISQSHPKFKQIRVVVNGALWHKIKNYTKYWFKEPRDSSLAWILLFFE